MKLTASVTFLTIAIGGPSASVLAQEYVVAVVEENFRARPNGAKLGTLKKGAPVSAVSEQGRWVEASLSGWIWAGSVKPARDRSTVLVTAGRENLRATPSPGGRLLGTVLRGTGLTRLGTRSRWVHVEYDGWIWEPSLSAGGTPDAGRTAPLPPGEPAEAASPLNADRTLAVAEENLRSAPNGSRLGVLRRGADLAVARRQASWLEVVTRGYFWAASATGSGSSRTVGKPTENLRIAPGSEVVGVLERGTPLSVLGRAGGWLEVELRGWIWEPSTLAFGSGRAPAEGADESEAARARGQRPAGMAGEPAADGTAAPAGGESSSAASESAATTRSPDTDSTAGTPASSSRRPGAVGPLRPLTHSVPLRDGPDGALVGQALAGTSVLPVRTSGEWVKVRFEGWMRQDALASASGPADSAPGGTVSVGMAVAFPDAYPGVETTWTLELIAVERADGSRSDFPSGQHYLLTRSAGGEREYVYVTVPEEVAGRFREMPPFTSLTIRGVIRTGRSALVGNPILEYREMLDSHSR